MMPEACLSAQEKEILLKIARQAIEKAVKGEPPPRINTDELPPHLLEPGVTFVTLTAHGALRGCIGALEAYQSLVEDVQEHAAAAALQDYRFPQVRPDELDEIEIEISRLTPPVRLDYENPEHLVGLLRPGIDGVLIRDGIHRATFLPQVWEKLPSVDEFMAHLCMKMGAPAIYWRKAKLDVYVYQVEEFHED